MVKRGVYEHFKGERYIVIGTASHSETMEQLVIYRKLYGDYDLTARPEKMFSGEVMTRDNGLVFMVPRFKLIKEIT